jgi:BirA family biotin operon repressor/biotin-[acetyl-CoA-carboxylase] ligase
MDIKQAILKTMLEKQDTFVSGEYLSQVCGCTRTAVWKHMEELRSEGYEIEAVKKSGYRLISAPDRIGAAEILAGMETKRIGRVVHAYDSVTSTQLLAHQEATQGAPEGTLVIADRQTGGKGRLGRVWHSPSGAGIWMTLILRPAIPIPKAPQMTLLTAVAMARALRETADVPVQIKWPNDLFIRGKKVCGILTELNAEADRINYLVIGIGLNVNTKREQIPEELAEIATSLYLESGREYKRASIVQRFCLAFEQLYDHYLEKGFAEIKAEWESLSFSLGKQVTVRTLHQTIYGKAVGLDAEGVLLVETADGQRHKVYSADVEIGAN